MVGEQGASPSGSAGKESAWNGGDLGLIPGLGRSPGGGHGSHSSIFAWRIPMDCSLPGSSVHGVTKSWTRLNDRETITRRTRGKQSVRVMRGRNQQNLTVWVGGRDGQTDLRLRCPGI